MSYYIETSSRSFKGIELREKLGAIFVDISDAREAIGSERLAVVVVMDNGVFQVAGFAFDMAEFEEFTLPEDLRTKEFLLMDRATAKALSGYPGN